MARNNKRNFVEALDSRTTWSYIGIDLAKYDSSIAATSDDGICYSHFVPQPTFQH